MRVCLCVAYVCVVIKIVDNFTWRLYFLLSFCVCLSLLHTLTLLVECKVASVHALSGDACDIEPRSIESIYSFI